MELKRNFTGINEKVRQVLDISRDEYAYCAYVLYRQADTRQKLRGWCCDTKEQLAHFVGISRPGLYKMTDRMVKAGLLEVDAPTGFLAVTPYFMDIENECKQGLQNEFEQEKKSVNKVYNDCKQSLHESENSVNLVTHNIGIEGVNKKEKEGNTPHPGKPDMVTPEKPNESKPDFAKLTVEEQLRAVYLYAQKKLAAVDSEAITDEEKAEKRVKYSNTLTALLSSDFRAVIEQYKQYRKGNKRIGKAGKWYDTEVTLCAVVAKLAELAGITNGAVNMANVRRVYEQTVENNYVGFYELKTPKESTTKQPTQNTQPAPRDVQGFNAIAEF